MKSEYPTDKRFCGKSKSRIVLVSQYEQRQITVGLIAASLTADANLLSLDCPAVAMRLEDVMKAKSPQVLVWHCQLCQQEQNKTTGHTHFNYTYLFFCLIFCMCVSWGGDWGGEGGGRWPHQVGFGVGRCLVDLPETEEALSISNATLQREYRGIRTTH